MSGIVEYVEKYGKKSFDESPFNEIDALVLSQLSYVDFSAIVCKFDSDVEITLADTANQYFFLHNEDELKEKISIVYKACLLLKQCAKTERYKNIKLLKYVNNVNDKIDKQFSAVTFYLNDKLAVIAFRGTDTSITGIKESAMLSYMFPVPAQIEGLYYLQESGMLAKRDLIICGHSKGGNLASFAGVSCSNSLKKRIIGIYEFDAPGFPEQMINRYDYIEMKDRIFSYIPQSSIIGCMLYHNSSRRIVKSTNERIKQHQVSSWIIEDNHFEFADETDETSKFIDKYLKELTSAVGQENIEEVFETIFDFIDGAGISNYEEIKTFHFVNLIKAINSLKSISELQKELIENTIKQAIKEFSQLVYREGVQSFNKKFAAIDEKK
ncbi:MAG: Mbeg1-like protein [Eubacterium sp.]